MDNLTDQVRAFVLSQRSNTPVPADLHGQIMARVHRATSATTSNGWRRQTTLSAAVLVFVTAMVFGFSELRTRTNLIPSPMPPGATHPALNASPGLSPTDGGVAVPGPSARFGMGMAFDNSRHETILFGGQGADGHYLGDTWSWNGIRWTQLTPKVSPPPRVNGALVWDDAHKLIVLYGGTGTTSTNSIGALSDMWSWNGISWIQLHPRHQPPTRSGASLAYDASTNAVVLFGGETEGRAPISLNDTWSWDGSDWKQANPTIAPSPRSGAVMAFDKASSGLILFGGAHGVPLNDTWEWTGKAWIQLNPARSPVNRYGASAVFDASTQQIVLFGGEGGDISQGPLSPLADTWTWDGSTWNDRHVISGPPPRWMAGLAYDESRRLVVLFGGPTETKSGSPLGDTWLWDGAVWRMAIAP